MDCIPYINDLNVEIEMLKEALQDCNNEKEYQNIINIIKSKEDKLQKYRTNLSKLSNNKIEYRLYLAILNGLTPSKAVEKVANENFMNQVKPSSVVGVWNYYYKLKEIIK